MLFRRRRKPAPPIEWGLKELPPQKGLIYGCQGKLKYASGFIHRLQITPATTAVLRALGNDRLEETQYHYKHFRALERRKSVVQVLDLLFGDRPNCVVRLTATPDTDLARVAKERVLIELPLKIYKADYDRVALCRKVGKRLKERMEGYDAAIASISAKPFNQRTMQDLYVQQQFREALQVPGGATAEHWFLAVVQCYLEAIGHEDAVVRKV